MNEVIKEKVKLELMTKSDPIPSFYDVLWAVGQNKVYFSSLSDKVADDFVDDARNCLARLAGINSRQLFQIQLGKQSPVHFGLEILQIHRCPALPLMKLDCNEIPTLWI